LESWRARLRFCISAAGVAAALTFPYLFGDSKAILSNLLGYHGSAGMWGLSQRPWYARVGVPVTFSAIAGLVVYLRVRHASLIYMIGSSILLFLVLTPGFSVQYLAWILPFCFLFGSQVGGAVYATSSVFLAIVYTYWSGGVPWYFADSLIPHAGSGLVGYSAALCWMTLAISIVSAIWLRSWESNTGTGSGELNQ
jgi:hypothetical protein